MGIADEQKTEFAILLTSLRQERHKQKRWGMDWSQRGVAKRLGVSRATYNYWENGKQLPLRDDRKNIVADFGLDETEETALYKLAAEVPPEIRYLPPHNPLFTGRADYLEQLHQLLQESGNVALTQPVSLSGLGGIGKTQLALAYAYSAHPKTYRAVLWVNAASLETLQFGYEELARRLGLAQPGEHDATKCIAAVKDWLADHTSWLLVMDNADDLQLARSFFPPTTSGHILLTTRSQFAGDIGARPLEIDKMTQADALLFLLRRSYSSKPGITPDTVAPEVRQAAGELVELLDSHPLALDQAGAYVSETHVSLATYIELYKSNRHDLLERRRAVKSEHGEHPDSVVVTFRLSFEKAAEQHPLATDILHLCAFLQPDAIPEELFQHDDVFKAQPLAFHEGIAALRRYSLIKSNPEDKTFSMHRLIQAVLIDDMLPDIQKQWRERVVQALNAAISEANIDNVRNWSRYVNFFLPVAACATWTDDELSPIVGAAELFYRFGTYLSWLDMLSEAETLVKRALSITLLQQGTEHPDTLKEMYELANIYWYLDEYEQSESLYQVVFRVWEKLLGPEHPEIISPHHQRAWFLLWGGEGNQACALLERALIIQEQRLGTAHPQTQKTKKDYVKFLRRVGRHAEAALQEAYDALSPPP